MSQGVKLDVFKSTKMSIKTGFLRRAKIGAPDVWEAGTQRCGGARRRGGGGGPKSGGQKFALFSLSRCKMCAFLLSLEVVELWPRFKAVDHPKCV